MKLRDRFFRFMYGRYGIDELYKLFSIILFVLIIANVFIRSQVLQIVVLLLWAVLLFRVFSRNVYARQRENRVYLNAKARIKNFFSLKKRKWKERKTHAYKKCPHCKATLRLPKIKGKHGVNCPKCKEHFEVKI